MKQLTTWAIAGTLSCACAYGCFILNKLDVFNKNKIQYDNGYNVGYEDGWNKSHDYWKATLIQADFAEYNRRTGQWQLIPIEDVATAATVLGKTKQTN